MPIDTCGDPSPDRKRPRTYSNTHEHRKTFTNHPTLYFEDGNVILKCGWMLFCVHRTLLSKHSEVFRGLFTPAGAEAKPQEFFRGCLFVALDDNSDDMETLLDTIYDGLRVEFQTLNAENFSTVAALLRMSTKYKLNRPRSAMLELLRSEWPSTLPKYDDAKAALASRCVNPPADEPVFTKDLGMHPAEVISLLRECDYNSPDLLVPLFYSLSTFISKFSLPPMGHNISALSAADTERFIIGLNKLRSLHAASSQCPIYAVTHPPPDGDSRQSILCQYGLLRYWHNIAGPQLLGLKDQMCHPIDDWGKVLQTARTDGIGGNAGAALCSGCKVKVFNHIGLTRQKVWDALPEVFGLN